MQTFALDCHQADDIHHVIWLNARNDVQLTCDVIPPSKLLSSPLYGGICRSSMPRPISSDSVCLRSVSADSWRGRYSDAGLTELALRRPSSSSLTSLRLWVSIEKAELIIFQEQRVMTCFVPLNATANRQQRQYFIASTIVSIVTATYRAIDYMRLLMSWSSPTKE